METKKLVHVVGHQCPDTDSVVSAVVAARLFSRIDSSVLYEPLMQGVANSQTVWLFNQAGVELPRIRLDVRPTVGEACKPAISLTPDVPLGEALDLLRTYEFSLVPVTTEEGQFLGALSFHLAEARYFTQFNLEDFLGVLVTVDEVVRGLELKRINPAAEAYRDPSEAVPASFRLYPGGQTSNPGDVLLAGTWPEAMAAAVAVKAAGVIYADCPEAEARAWTRDVPVPAYHFSGSLMALLTQLPRAIPVGRVLSSNVPTARADDLLHDLHALFVSTPHALPVLDAEDRLCGVISRREALQPPRFGLVLVDHFERTQTVRGWEQADIVQIIDHHRVGGLETLEPARVDCRPLGSTASILALRFVEAGFVPDEAEAKLLLGALVADTLLLTSPTTTERDRLIAAELAGIAGVELGPFGREVLSRNDGLATDSAAALITRDLKAFSRGDVRFLLGQIETVDLTLLDAELAQRLGVELEAARTRAGAAFALTMVTDVLRGVSRLLSADPDSRRARHLLQGELPTAGVEYTIVSRKKELVPMVMERLGSYKP